MRHKNLLTIIVLTALLFSSLAHGAITNPAPGVFADFGADNNARTIIVKIIQLLLQIAGVLAVLFLIIGGFQYITSGSNRELVDSGKRTVTNAIIGIVIIVLSYTIVNIVNGLFG